MDLGTTHVDVRHELSLLTPRLGGCQPRSRYRISGAHTGPPRGSSGASGSSSRPSAGSRSRSSHGELFGLLGPNGAGKTTTIKVLTTLLLPTAGVVRVLGMDVVSEAREVRRQIGYVFGGERGLYERLSALDNLRYFAELYSVEPRVQGRRIAELLDLVGLSGREKERVEGYSRGMRQRLHIARGLIHDPPVLFLDEPTIGVDPVGARELRSIIGALRDAGKTILLTTHYMFEADALCQRIAVITAGQIVAQGTPRELKAVVADRSVVEVEAYGVPAAVIERLRGLPGVTSVAVEDRDQAQVLSVHSDRGANLTQVVVEQLDGVRVERVSTREPTLEDAYIALVTRE
ncbi:MAG: ATP-binding cassette domain-containing protein [Candidatus Dormibacteria bacterium]